MRGAANLHPYTLWLLRAAVCEPAFFVHCVAFFFFELGEWHRSGFHWIGFDGLEANPIRPFDGIRLDCFALLDLDPLLRDVMGISWKAFYEIRLRDGEEMSWHCTDLMWTALDGIPVGIQRDGVSALHRVSEHALCQTPPRGLHAVMSGFSPFVIDTPCHVPTGPHRSGNAMDASWSARIPLVPREVGRSGGEINRPPQMGRGSGEGLI